MKNIYFPFFLLILLCIQNNVLADKHNVLSKKEIADGWQLLFDGKTMTGWHDYNKKGELSPNWVVSDGTIFAQGGGSDASGYIVTDKIYENFVIVWDWKVTKGGNSGVLYHVVERPQFKVPYVTGPEYQMIDNENFQGKLEEWQQCGADYAMYVADTKKLKLKPYGEWNTSKIVFDNGSVEHWLNGEKIITFSAWNEDWFAKKNSGKWTSAPEYGLATKGVFCLQDHGDKTQFRNLKVKMLPRKKSEVVLFNGKDLTGWEIYGNEKWYVENGLLICESGEKKEYGYLATRQYYDDYELTLDFKQEADGNSGVFIRSFIEEGVKVNGWQVEVAPKGYGTGGVYESYGRGWLIQIPKEKEEFLKVSDWNTMKIRVVGNKLTSWLNGHEMVSFIDEKIGKGQGRIALQIHDGGGIRVLWKNIKLKTL